MQKIVEECSKLGTEKALLYMHFVELLWAWCPCSWPRWSCPTLGVVVLEGKMWTRPLSMWPLSLIPTPSVMCEPFLVVFVLAKQRNNLAKICQNVFLFLTRGLGLRKTFFHILFSLTVCEVVKQCGQVCRGSDQKNLDGSEKGRYIRKPGVGVSIFERKGTSHPTQAFSCLGGNPSASQSASRGDGLKIAASLMNELGTEVVFLLVLDRVLQNSDFSTIKISFLHSIAVSPSPQHETKNVSFRSAT